MELKEHAARCKGVEELFEKEEKQNSRLKSRSETASEERQRLVTECTFFKERPREVVVFNPTKEPLSRSELLI